MNRTSIATKTLIAAAVAALVSAPAFAGQITYTHVQPNVVVPQGAVFTLQQFDPAWGTLTQVDLTWELSASINAQISQDGTAGSAYVDGADIQYTFNAPQVSITKTNEPIFSFSWLGNTPSPIVFAPSGAAIVGGGQQVNSVNWAPYIGPNTFDVSWTMAAYNASAGPVWVGSGGYTGAVLDDRLGGYNFSVTYTYVPEPGSLALVLAGLASFGFRSKQRKA